MCLPTALLLVSGDGRAPRGPGCGDPGMGAGAAELALVAGRGAEPEATTARFPQAITTQEPHDKAHPAILRSSCAAHGQATAHYHPRSRSINRVK